MAALSFKSTDGGWIDQAFVEEAKATMDPILWRQEFEASIESLLEAVYPDFNRQNIAPTEFSNSERLVFGVDFNRTPFGGCILQVQGDRLAVLKEHVLINSDTHEMAQAVRADFPFQEILCCPHPTGRRLQTSSAMGLSDLEYRAGASVPDPKSNHSHMAAALGYACIALQKGLLPWNLGVTGFRVS